MADPQLGGVAGRATQRHGVGEQMGKRPVRRVGLKAVEGGCPPLVAENAESGRCQPSTSSMHGIDTTDLRGENGPSLRSGALLGTARSSDGAPMPMRSPGRTAAAELLDGAAQAVMAAGATLARSRRRAQRQVMSSTSTSKWWGLQITSRVARIRPNRFRYDVVGNHAQRRRRAPLTQVGDSPSFGVDPLTPSAWARRCKGHEADVVGEFLA